MNSQMKTSKAGIDLIKRHEAWRATGYLDPVGVPTVGWGHTGPDVSVGMKITKAEGEALLVEDLAEAEDVVKAGVVVPLTQSQFDALTSFCFNVGPGKKNKKDGFLELKRGGQSTLLKKINQEDYEGASLEFGKWVSAKGQVLKGLVNRRNEEQELFLKDTVPEEKPLESNVEPTQAEPAKPIGTKGVQATVGVSVGAVLTEVAKQFEPLQQYGSFIQTIFVGLTIAGIIYGIYGARKGN